jgi:hypothetical protein
MKKLLLLTISLLFFLSAFNQYVTYPGTRVFTGTLQVTPTANFQLGTFYFVKNSDSIWIEKPLGTWFSSLTNQGSTSSSFFALDTITINITNSNILNGDDIKLISNPGVDTTIILTNIVFTYLDNGTAYIATGSNLIFIYSYLGITPVNIATLDAESFINDYDFDSYISVSANKVSSNKEIRMKIPNQYTTGTSTAKIQLIYYKKRR